MLEDQSVVESNINANSSSVELSTSHEFVSPRMNTLNKLLDAGAVSTKVNEHNAKRIVVDLEKSAQVLNEFQDEPILTNERDPQLLLEQVKKNYSVVVQGFLETGVLDQATLAELQRLNLDNNIVLSKEVSRFLYTGHAFPDNESSAARIEVSPAWFRFTEEGVRREMVSLGIELTDTQLFELAARRFIAHEVGHGIEKAKTLSKSENKYGQNATRDNYFATIEEVERRVYDRAPHPILNQILDGEDENGSYTRRSFSSSERIAMGYEYVEACRVFREMGFSEDRISNLMRDTVDYQEKFLKDWLFISDKAKTLGLTVELLGQSLTEIKMGLRDKMDKEILDRSIPHKGFGSSQMGYMCGLTPDQIKQTLLSA